MPSLPSTTTALILSTLSITIHALPQPQAQPAAAVASANDPYHDNTPFLFAARSPFTILTTAAPTCASLPAPPRRTYTLASEPGENCTYQSFVEHHATSLDPAAGVAECQAYCDASASCRLFSWFLDPVNASDEGGCELADRFFDADTVQCNQGSTNSHLAVYEADNWTPPAEYIPNGGFESGCLEPAWFFSDFTSDESMVPTVVDCVALGAYSANATAGCTGSKYLQVTGNGQNGDTRDKIDAYIGQQPALEDGAVYRLSASVKVPVGGEVRFTYPVHKSVVVRSAGTGEWVDVVGELEGRVSAKVSSCF